MFETDIASATNRNTTPEHPNPESLIPSNLLDSLPQRSPPSPHHTYSLPPSISKQTLSTLPNPNPQTPPCLASQQPPSRLPTSWHQQWLYCTPEQAEIWKPRKIELHNLNKKLKKHVCFASAHDAEEIRDSEQKQWPQRPFGLPNGSSPTKPTPHSDNENGPTTPGLQNLDHKLLETQTQRHTEDTHSAHAHQASESVESKLGKREMRRHEEQEVEKDVGAILGDGDEEKGGVLSEHGGGAGGGGGEEVE